MWVVGACHGGDTWWQVDDAPGSAWQGGSTSWCMEDTLAGAVSAPDVVMCSHVVLAVRGSQASWDYKSEIKTAWMLSP